MQKTICFCALLLLARPIWGATPTASSASVEYRAKAQPVEPNAAAAKKPRRPAAAPHPAKGVPDSKTMRLTGIWALLAGGGYLMLGLLMIPLVPLYGISFALGLGFIAVMIALLCWVGVKSIDQSYIHGSEHTRYEQSARTAGLFIAVGAVAALVAASFLLAGSLLIGLAFVVLFARFGALGWLRLRRARRYLREAPEN